VQKGEIELRDLE
ncbi:hypothetical protein A2U01_0083254, partial [Trifolium medium]|nr:hypothetical protein [Trifolium medium]